MSDQEFPKRIPETEDGRTIFNVPFPADPEDLQSVKKLAPIVLKQPYQIEYIYALGQDSPFFAGLANKRLLGTRDPQSGYTYGTPRGHDMATGHETDWVDLTERKATIHAFTVCHFGSEEFLPETPFVLALIAFEGADTLFLTRLVGVDPNAATLDWIGMEVTPRFRRLSKFKPTDVYFVPASS